MQQNDLDSAVILHLQEIAIAKRALLQIALTINSDYPSEATVLVRACKSLTRSADKLLGDTSLLN
jgi:hypothetical protein